MLRARRAGCQGCQTGPTCRAKASSSGSHRPPSAVDDPDRVPRLARAGARPAVRRLCRRCGAGRSTSPRPSGRRSSTSSASRFRRPWTRVLADGRCRAPAGSRARPSTTRRRCFGRATADRPALLAASERRPLRAISWAELGRRRRRGGRGPASARGRPRRPGRRRRPEHPRGGRRPPRVRQPRGDLVELLARVRDPQRRRPLRPDRAEGPHRRRRLRLRRQGVRSAAASSRSSERALAEPRADRPHPGSRPDGRAAPATRALIDLGRAPPTARRGPLTFESVPFDHPAVDPLLVGHDRAAEGHRPRPRRGRPRARQGGRAAPRRPARRPAVLVHDDRLDDVELPGRCRCSSAARRSSTTAARAIRTSTCCGRLAADGRVDALRGERGLHREPAGRPGSRPAAATTCRALRCIGSTGSPLPVDGFRWVYDAVGRTSGWPRSAAAPTSSAPSSAAARMLPVRAGELQCRALGARVEAFDEAGRSVVGQTGELVLTAAAAVHAGRLLERPRRRAATARATSRCSRASGATATGSGSTERGSAVIEGRSDSTLNRGGIRFGTSELYGVVEGLPEVADSLVIGLEQPDGGYWMPLFVVLRPGVDLDDRLRDRIRATHPGRPLAAPRPRRDHRGARRSRGR